ncbi:MAG: hypothetical protein ACI4U0_01860 [Candidatus Aphodocola sp.]
MEKERRTKVLSLAALIVALLGLTVAFAALSQTLTINGNASVDAATWDIHFETPYGSDATTQGAATINKTPTFNGTSITDIDVSITKPDDLAYWSFKIVNNGTINAKISSIEISKLCTIDSPVESCDWNNDGTVTQEDVDKVNNNISFVFFRNDSDAVEFKTNDTLNAGEQVEAELMIGYLKADISEGTLVESTELPKRDLTFSNLSVTINYVQAD